MYFKMARVCIWNRAYFRQPGVLSSVTSATFHLDINCSISSYSLANNWFSRFTALYPEMPDCSIKKFCHCLHCNCICDTILENTTQTDEWTYQVLAL